jgi:hypothetical protein
MKRFERREIREAIQYAQEGGQALHVWEPGAYRHTPGLPEVFRRSRLWAHLFDQDLCRLLRTAKALGVRVIKVEYEGTPRQHIDLCGRPLVRAIEECWLKCDDCGRTLAAVATVNDPYLEEIHDEIVEITVCSECLQEYLDDI